MLALLEGIALGWVRRYFLMGGTVVSADASSTSCFAAIAGLAC